MNIESIFIELEETDTSHHGQLQRRVSTVNTFAVYVGITKPSNLRGLRLECPHNDIFEKLELPQFKLLTVTKEVKNHSVVIQISTKETTINDVFTSLINDVLSQMATSESANDCAITLQARLLKWQRLLQRSRWTGLTEEEQRGLYGELSVLDDYVLEVLEYEHALQTWTGINGTAKDFEFISGTALEVKTTLTNLPHIVSIANERQLDAKGYKDLYLLVRYVEVSQFAGESLPNRIGLIRRRLENNTSSLLKFENMLETIGYSDLHTETYSKFRYITKSLRLYLVRDEFPRIVGDGLLTGVCNIKYSIDLSACDRFELDIEELKRSLVGEH